MSSSLFKQSVTNFYLLLFFIGLSVSSIVLDIKYSNSNYIRIFINDFLINPIQYLASTPSTFFSSMVKERETIEVLTTKIEALEKENTTMKINLQSPEIREELKKVLRVLIKAFKKMNHNSIPQEEQKKLLQYVGNDKELNLFLIKNGVMNKEIATYAKEQRRINTIKKVLSKKIPEEKIVDEITNEILGLGGKTKKRKNKKSKSHKNKTKGKKNKSKSKKKTSLNNYDIYRMPY